MTVESTKLLRIAIVGSPNAGKTTLFNSLTGANYKTVNYPGSTVSFSKGTAKKSLRLDATIKDTPGISTLIPSSADQQVTVGQLFDSDGDDLIVAVVDVTQLSRHLYLVDQLRECGFRMLLCVTMIDLLEEKGAELDIDALSERMGVRAVMVDARKSSGLEKLTAAMRQMVGQDAAAIVIQRPEPPTKEEIHSRYTKVEAIEHEVVTPAAAVARRRRVDLDRVFLHPVWGGALFALIMFLVFSAIFWLADIPMNTIDGWFGLLIGAAKAVLPDSWMTDLLADGLIAGIGMVVVFLPQIAILFLLLGYLEDTGYLARGAMVMDRPLSRIGLNGKSFVPLLSGFACAIPAILAARSVNSRKERLLTIFIIPLMSCSARLPIYVLLIKFLMPNRPWMCGLAMAGLYLGGIVAGTVAATIISKLPSYRKRSSSLLLELPMYRKPQLKVVLTHTYHRCKHYLRKAGPTIVVISLALWLLTHLPLAPGEAPGDDREYATVAHSYAAQLGKVLEPVMEPMGLDWRGGVAMMMGFAAREVFVAALALVYRMDQDQGQEDDQAVLQRLLHKMPQITFEGTDQRIFTLSSCIGLLFFFTVALQCFPTVVTVKSEVGSWKLPLFQLGVFTGAAYLGAVAIVQVLRLCGLP